ncbi:MAG: hypothetical protein Q9195_003753 [Heterodermia aff. obscurata]
MLGTGQTAEKNTYQTIPQAAEPRVQGVILVTKESCKVHRAVVVGCSYYVARQRDIGATSERDTVRVQAIRQHISRRDMLDASVVVGCCREVGGIALARALDEGRDRVRFQHALGVSDYAAFVGARVAAADAVAVIAVDERWQDAEREKNASQGRVFCIRHSGKSRHNKPPYRVTTRINLRWTRPVYCDSERQNQVQQVDFRGVRKENIESFYWGEEDETKEM